MALQVCSTHEHRSQESMSIALIHRWGRSWVALGIGFLHRHNWLGSAQATVQHDSHNHARSKNCCHHQLKNAHHPCGWFSFKFAYLILLEPTIFRTCWHACTQLCLIKWYVVTTCLLLETDSSCVFYKMVFAQKRRILMQRYAALCQSCSLAGWYPSGHITASAPAVCRQWCLLHRVCVPKPMPEQLQIAGLRQSLQWTVTAGRSFKSNSRRQTIPGYTRQKYMKTYEDIEYEDISRWQKYTEVL